MLKIRNNQFEQLEKATSERQAREIAKKFAHEIEKHDTNLAARILKYSQGYDLEFLDRLLTLTNIEQYQKFLLFTFIQTGINFFENNEFKYILDHPLLSDNAKARHISLSSFIIMQGRG